MAMDDVNLKAKDYFTYNANFLSLAGGTSATQNILIEASSDFVWYKAEYFADIALAIQTDSTRVIPLCTVLIVDSGSGRQIMDIATPIPSIFGDGKYPYILPQPKRYVARTNIAITVANFTAATTYNIRLSFSGTKLFF
jgi:hypothetical protein